MILVTGYTGFVGRATSPPGWTSSASIGTA